MHSVYLSPAEASVPAASEQHGLQVLVQVLLQVLLQVLVQVLPLVLLQALLQAADVTEVRLQRTLSQRNRGSL